MNAAKRLGRLGVAMLVVIAGLVVDVAPASAATGGLTRYENVGNPTWCMSADMTSVYLTTCAYPHVWEWETVGQDRVRLYFTTSREECLTALNGGGAFISECGNSTYGQHQSWYVWGRNGWVVYEKPGTGLCLTPQGTHVVAPYYTLALVPCPSQNNVPNIYAWRYFL